jgi:hypothetical protein
MKCTNNTDNGDDRAQRRLVIWLYIGGLLILLLNDFYLKEEFHNALTGKLSDFTGLLISPIFFAVVFRAKSKLVFIFTAILFILWKNPLSDEALALWNANTHLQLERVADKSDYVALISIWIGYLLIKRIQIQRLCRPELIGVGILSVFAFSATSYMNELEVDKTYSYDVGIDRLKVELLKTDSTEWNFDNRREIIAPDTVTAYVEYDFCFDGFIAEIIVDGDSVRSSFTIDRVIHNCPLNKDKIWGPEIRDDKAILSSVIERRIKEALRNL